MGVHITGCTDHPDKMVILLHGYGANGEDLLGLGDAWKAQFPTTIFIAPDAPNVCEISPFGYQWFSLGDWSPVSMTTGVRTIAPRVNAFIDEQLAHYNIAEENLVLCGFSQGTMLALYVALRRARKMAGVLGYSGALICTEDWNTIDLQKPDICLVHGIADNVVPVAAYYHAAQMLEQDEFPFEGHVLHGLMHGINDYGVGIGREFLARVLG